MTRRRFLANIRVCESLLSSAQDPRLPLSPHTRTTADTAERPSSKKSWPSPRSTISSSSAILPMATSSGDGWQAPSFLSVPGAKDVGHRRCSTMSGLQHGQFGGLGFASANRQMLSDAEADQGLLRLRNLFQAVQIAAIVGPPGHGEPGRLLAQVAEYQMRRDVV